jgi:PTS system cellobiose-specific IIB component
MSSKLKILLICSAGTSTSLLVKKMEELCLKKGYQYEIESLGSAEAKLKYRRYDVLLLGPQVSYMFPGLKEYVGDKPLEKMSPIMYGRLDAVGLIKQAEELHKKNTKK